MDDIEKLVAFIRDKQEECEGQPYIGQSEQWYIDGKMDAYEEIIDELRKLGR